jgi:hypothetical protein
METGTIERPIKMSHVEELKSLLTLRSEQSNGTISTLVNEIVWSNYKDGEVIKEIVVSHVNSFTTSMIMAGLAVNALNEMEPIAPPDDFPTLSITSPRAGTAIHSHAGENHTATYAVTGNAPRLIWQRVLSFDESPYSVAIDGSGSFIIPGSLLYDGKNTFRFWLTDDGMDDMPIPGTLVEVETSVHSPNPVPTGGIVPVPSPAPSPDSGPDADFIRTHGESIPNFGKNYSVCSVKDGLWSDEGTWSTDVPIAGDIVRIKHKVGYDISSTVKIDTIGIEGTLEFENGTELDFTNILVYEGGSIQFGTPTERAKEIELWFNDVPVSDPEQFSNGILVWGAWKPYGAKRRRFVQVAKEPKAGDTAIWLAAYPIGWQPGDRLVISDTRVPFVSKDKKYQKTPGNKWEGAIIDSQTEFMTIASILGNVLTLAEPLKHDHLGSYEPDGSPTVLDDGTLFLPHVGNMTNEITIQSSGQTRGHIMFLNRAEVDQEGVTLKNLGRTNILSGIDNTITEHRVLFNEPFADIEAGQVVTLESAAGEVRDPDNRGEARNLWYAELAHGVIEVYINDIRGGPLGRKLDTSELSRRIKSIGTNQIGRYPVHFHHLAGPVNPRNTGWQFCSLGCVVEGSPKWGFVGHHSHFGLLGNNLAVGCEGAGFALESGAETGNDIINNMSVGSLGTGLPSRQKLTPSYGGDWVGHEGTGFWLGGENNNVVGNVSCGHRMSGYNMTLLPISHPKLCLWNRIAKYPLVRGADMHDGSGQYTTNPYDPALPRFNTFKGNTVYGTAKFGMELWFKRTFTELFGLHGWNILTGITYGYQALKFTENGTVLRGYMPMIDRVDHQGNPLSAGLDFLGKSAIDVTNLDIRGFAVGVIGQPSRGGFDVSDSTIQAHRGVVIVPTGQSEPIPVNLIGMEFIPMPEGESIPVSFTPHFYESSGGDIMSPRIFTLTLKGGEEYELFSEDQAPDHVIGKVDPAGKSGTLEAGLTNLESLHKYGIAYGGKVATCAVSALPIENGLACLKG